MRRRRRRRTLRLVRTCVMAAALAVGLFLVISDVTASSREAATTTTSTTGPHSKAKVASTTRTTVVSDGTKDLFTVPAIATYLKSSTFNVTAAVYDEQTGVTSLYRPGVTEQCASIMKVDILATLMSEAQALNLTALPADQQALAQQMIEESNNDDAQDLWDIEGGASAVSAFDARVGMTDTAPNTAGYWGLSTTTAADQVALVRKVAFPNSLLDTNWRDYELSLMTQVDPSQAWGISSGPTAGVTVAIKNGWLPNNDGIWQVNSIGWVSGAGRDYVIAVLTNGDPTEEDGIQTIQGLSSLIWDDLAPTRT
jgi:hypothetical protein